MTFVRVGLRWAPIGFAAMLLATTAAGASVRQPLTFVWPTSVALETEGSLLVVENGLRRVVRVQPTTGRVTEVASGFAKPFAVVRTSSGLLVSDGHSLVRIVGHGGRATVTRANADIGPIAVAPNGDVVFATETRVFRLARGSTRAVGIAGGASGSRLNGPHGIAIAPNGAVLVSDTGNKRVLRVDPRTGATTLLMKIANPRGLEIARDGMLYVVDAASKRVVRFSASGKRIGVVGPAFDDPYALALAPAGGIWVVDTAVAGKIRYVSAAGAVSTLMHG